MPSRSLKNFMSFLAGIPTQARWSWQIDRSFIGGMHECASEIQNPLKSDCSRAHDAAEDYSVSSDTCLSRLHRRVLCELQ
eukprot:m.731457 g.731457  ORF g.731457 m.731457 type:complete len:80 (-) comp58872_c0_seq9:38-277(-)